MSALLPISVYGLKVPAGEVMIPALDDLPATFRITMAAIDPSAKPEYTDTDEPIPPPRATLRLVYRTGALVDEDHDEDEDESNDEDSNTETLLKALIANEGAGEDEEDSEDDEDEEEDSDDEEEKNGGPSDPSKTKKARKQAALEQILDSMASETEENGMDVDGSPKVNGLVAKADKGKGKELDEDEEDAEDDNEDDYENLGMKEMVICTLDPEKNYQQALDITVPKDQDAYFSVSGTHAVYLTGNYVVPADNGPGGAGFYDDEEEDSDEDYDLELDDDASDHLDDLKDPRVTEVDSEEETEVPTLVKKDEPVHKGKNKRPAEDSEDEPVNLDDIMAKSLKPEEVVQEPKLSKKQLKKLRKNNEGKSVEVAEKETKDAKGSDKKVQFAKVLEAPPANPQSTPNGNIKTEKTALGVKMVQGVKVDDKKLGKGPAAKNGNTVDMRYIGKLKDGKVFDANKSGKPFSFKLGTGSVIKGWDIGVAGMSAGGERRIVVPANLAYGKKSMPDIPSNSELTFDLKLLAVK